MSRIAAFALGAAVTAVAAALFLSGAPDRASEDVAWRERALEAERRIAELREELARERGPAPTARAPRAASPATRAPAPTSPPNRRELPPRAPEPPRADAEAPDARLDPAWDDVVRGALRSEVQRRLGRELSPEREAKLLARLDAVREAGLALDGEEPADASARRRQRLMRGIVLLEADRSFREEVGFGIAEFLSGLDEGSVEDLGAPAVEELGAPAVEELGGPAVEELGGDGVEDLGAGTPDAPGPGAAGAPDAAPADAR